MLRHWARALALAALLLATAPGAAADREVYDAVDAFLASQMERTNVPGLAVALVKDGEIVHARGFGEADPSGREVTAQTPFLIASITKTLTATIVMQLHEEGALDIDDPVRVHVPEFALAGEEGGASITIRHLLSHTAGLPTVLPGEFDRAFRPARGGDLEDEVARLRNVEPVSEPGERFQYSNVGYATLALVIEAATGKAYEDVVRERIHGPLGMTNSTARPADARALGAATPYRSWFGAFVPWSYDVSRTTVGAGFTYASAEDLARFAAAHLDGPGNGTLRVSEASLAQMWTPHATVRPEPFAREAGLGWYLDELHGRRLMVSEGAGPMVRADVIVMPDDGWAIALVTNGNDLLRGGSIQSLALGVASVLIGEPPRAPDGFGLTLPAFWLVWGGSAILALGLVVAILRRARVDRVGSLRRAAVGVAWVALCLAAVPALTRWPLDALAISIPDLWAGLWLGAAVGAAYVGAGAVGWIRAGRAA